eukprot:TRINITY_DN22204_c0_g1_i1.p1 TRINITY_DN22204_c0_g1~~TRINITY_DN22204_c0_g1_i1.p1  ORF type:complete len:186 (-),score=6.42 TRINITY_DN22204_c0_g1_i1:187-744(-)
MSMGAFALRAFVTFALWFVHMSTCFRAENRTSRDGVSVGGSLAGVASKRGRCGDSICWGNRRVYKCQDSNGNDLVDGGLRVCAYPAEHQKACVRCFGKRFKKLDLVAVHDGSEGAVKNLDAHTEGNTGCKVCGKDDFNDWEGADSSEVAAERQSGEKRHAMGREGKDKTSHIHHVFQHSPSGLAK